MKPEMRAALTREPYEEKIQKVEQLIRLAKDFGSERTKPAAEMFATAEEEERAIISAIRGRAVLEFMCNSQPRIVEPQTYGISTAGRPILRAYQRSSGSSSRQANGLRLFDLAKMSLLRKTTERFLKARPEHNPNDSAMKEIRATLPLPD